MTSPSHLPGNYFTFGWWPQLQVIRQSEEGECGLACVAMIAQYNGHSRTLRELRTEFSTSRHGTSLSALVNIAGNLGFNARPLRVDLSEVPMLKMPCILHLNSNHFVVLEKILRKGAVQIVDPAVGRRKLSKQKLSDAFTGVALELSRSHVFKPKASERPMGLQRLMGRVTGLTSSLTKIFLLGLVLEIISLQIPLFTQVVLDNVLSTYDKSFLLLISIGFCIVIVVQTLVAACRAWAVSCLGASLKVGWTANACNHLLKLPDDYFSRRHLGDIVSRVGGIEVIQRTLTTKVVESVLDGIMAVITLIVLSIYSHLLAGMAVFGVVLHGISRYLSFAALRESNVDVVNAAARQQSLLLETIRGAAIIRLFNKRSSRVAVYVNTVVRTTNASLSLESLNIFFSTINSSVAGFARLATLFLGATLVMRGDLSAGMMIAAVSYGDQFNGRLNSLIDFSAQVVMLRVQGERLADIVQQPPEPGLVEQHHSSSSIAPPAMLEARGIYFRYSDRDPWILKDVHLSVSQGECVAVVGASGCGKTTLAKILSSQILPTAGAVAVDGVPILTRGVVPYRELLGVVLQDDQLFGGSIAQNVSFFDESPIHERIVWATETAGLHMEIMQLPLGYETQVGDMGHWLSGGQRQRLCLARALYKKPAILILDEATSHLDIHNESIVSENISKLGIMRILIAHRPETMARADRVLQLYDGQLREVPKPERLRALS